MTRRYRTDASITQEILEAMGADNGCTFIPCRRHANMLRRLVGECWAQRLEFTSDQICTIAYGEQTEQETLVKKYPSGPALSRCLNKIFDGCKLCHSRLPLRGGA